MTDELNELLHNLNTAIEYIRTQTAQDTHEHNLVQYWLNYIEKKCNLKETKCKPEEKE